jgi:outer membrane lipoprotein LolB
MRRIAPLLLSAALVGCAAVPRAPAITGLPVDADRVTTWSAAGRMAVAVAGDGGSGSFDWAQRGSTTELQVRGPFGAGALSIVTDGNSLAVTDGDGRVLDAQAARDALRARLGVDLPLAEMRYWMLGLAAPGADAQVSPADAGAASIEQSGWTVTYEPLVVAQGWTVPSRFVVASPVAKIKVVVDQWRLPDAGSATQDGARP